MSELRLRHAARLRVEPSDARRPLITLDQVESGTGRLLGQSECTGPDGQIRFEPGDVLFSKLRPYLAKSALVAEAAHGTGELLAMVPDPLLLDPRYLLYLTLSRSWLDLAELTSYGTKMPRTSWEAMSNHEVPVTDTEEQRRIADSLDDQTKRINQVIVARRRQLASTRDLPWAGFFEVARGCAPKVPLRRVVDLVADGPFGSAFASSDYVDDGPAVIRLGNIGFAEFRGDDLARVPEAIFQTFPRCHIRPGDVLVASLGDETNHAGRACVAPDALGPAMVKGKVFRVVVDPRRADPTYVATLLSSSIAANELALEGRGSTRNMINIGILLSAVLPFPSMRVQQLMMKDFRLSSGEASTRAQAAERSIQLLQELKRSLISSAVSGEFDLSAASGRGVPV
jgi:type I restriction enzyme S subunit